MAKIGLRLKIDVSKIEKARLFKGEKGTYLDATVFVNIDELDQYGNSGMITQDVKMVEKQSGVQGAILGNCKVFWNDGGQPQKQQQYAPPQQQQYASPQYAPPQPQHNQKRPAPRPQSNLTPPPPLNTDDGWDEDIPF
jgi:hypothetical protein